MTTAELLLRRFVARRKDAAAQPNQHSNTRATTRENTYTPEHYEERIKAHPPLAET